MIRFSCARLVAQVILILKILYGINGQCFPRKYVNGGGSKGIPNKMINSEAFQQNKEICIKISDPIECADKNRDLCLWCPIDGDLHEGPTIKSINFISAKPWKPKQNEEIIEKPPWEVPYGENEPPAKETRPREMKLITVNL